MAKITEGGDIDPIGVLIATGHVNFHHTFRLIIMNAWIDLASIFLSSQSHLKLKECVDRRNMIRRTCCFCQGGIEGRKLPSERILHIST